MECKAQRGWAPQTRPFIFVWTIINQFKSLKKHPWQHLSKHISTAPSRGICWDFRIFMTFIYIWFASRCAIVYLDFFLITNDSQHTSWQPIFLYLNNLIFCVYWPRFTLGYTRRRNVSPLRSHHNNTTNTNNNGWIINNIIYMAHWFNPMRNKWDKL